jgi:ABC-type branched-subunit amino acid transport system substrate-binding protein
MNGKRPFALNNRICLTAVALLVALNAVAAPLSDLEARGNEIYFTGIDKAGPEPKAFLGTESTPAPARLAPCGSCHGEDGRGRPEGNIAPPDITWDRLTNAGAVQRGVGGESLEASISKAIAEGVGREGKRLESIMPRYSLSHEQMDALLAYLKIIAKDQAPGVGSDTIRIAIILPAKSATAAHDVIRQICLAYFEGLNGRGGIFNRRIEAMPFDANEALDTLKRRIENREIFALVILDAGTESDEIIRLADETKTPSIAASTRPINVTPDSRYRFSIFPDVATQMRVLVDFVAQTPDRLRRIAMLYDKEEAPVEIREAVERQLTKWRLPQPIDATYQARSFDARAAVARLSSEAVDSVIFLAGGPELAAFLDVLKRTDWRPRLLISSRAIGPTIFDAPGDISGGIFLALSLLADQPAKDTAFLALHEQFGIPKHHVASQVAAYCAALILAEGLKGAGREISRATFVEALENLRDFDTGVSHRLSFGPNRHVGNNGAYVVGVEPSARRFKIVSDWRPPQ